MARRLFGAKPLPEPMLVYCKLDSWEQSSVKFESEFYHFHLKYALEINVVFQGGGDELTHLSPDKMAATLAVVNICQQSGFVP